MFTEVTSWPQCAPRNPTTELKLGTLGFAYGRLTSRPLGWSLYGKHHWKPICGVKLIIIFQSSKGRLIYVCALSLNRSYQLSKKTVVFWKILQGPGSFVNSRRKFIITVNNQRRNRFTMRGRQKYIPLNKRVVVRGGIQEVCFTLLETHSLYNSVSNGFIYGRSGSHCQLQFVPLTKRATKWPYRGNPHRIQICRKWLKFSQEYQLNRPYELI